MREVSKTIEWKDVIENMVQKVQTVCSNIRDLTEIGLPKDLINGNTITLGTGSRYEKVNGTVNNEKLASVTRDTIETQLTNFLATRGVINSKHLNDKAG